jgi:peptide/nickel transport system substrate-binding protein
MTTSSRRFNEAALDKAADPAGNSREPDGVRDARGMSGKGSSAIDRRSVLTGLLLGSSGLLAGSDWNVARAQAGQKVLRVGMTLSDIPQITGQATGGAEGIRFVNFTIYDALVSWNFDQGDKPTHLIPNLAESWSVDDATQTIWTFKTRADVRFHDGSLFDARAAVWNFDKLLKKDAPQFDPRQAAQVSYYLATVRSVEALDERTFTITTKSKDAALLYSLSNIFLSSPARWEEVGRNWEKFSSRPSGTGPWMFDRLVPRERLELLRHEHYWNAKRIPKCDRLVLRPIPDSTTRVAALLSNQVDFIEAAPPDAVPQIKAAGMQITSNIYPHIWPYMLSHQPDSPFHDIRLRKAANLAIDRDGIVKLVGGFARPAKGLVVPEHPWFGKPTFDIRYDPDEARKLMTEAGYGPGKPAKIKFLISSAGSGQMQPLSMNELVQENLQAVGFDVALETIDWETLRARRVAGAEAPENRGLSGINYSWTIQEPIFALIGQTWHGAKRVPGFNWGGFADDRADELALPPLQAFDPEEQNRLLAKLHAYLVDQAMWIFVVHDLNPRAMSARVKGFVSAQNWYQDLSPIDMKI